MDGLADGHGDCRASWSLLIRCSAYTTPVDAAAVAGAERALTDAYDTEGSFRVHAHVHISPPPAKPQQPRAFLPMMQFCIGK